MKIVLAPNAFKGTASAAEIAAAMAQGVHRALPGCVTEEIPVADGGDGLHAIALAHLDGGVDVPATVTGPCFDPVATSFVVDRAAGLAVIETARACGLARLGEHRPDPTRTTTLGAGELVRAALDEDARHLLVGLGGSATNDGGVGAAMALGWRFGEASGRPITPVGGALADVVTVDGSGRDPRLAGTTIELACDVDNPLCGPDGAAAVYGPQKGATPAQVAALDRGLAHLADVVAAATGDDRRAERGAGAAGGLGFGLGVFAGGIRRRGTDVVFALVGLEHRLAGADLVLTGEGRIDEQTLRGKAPAAVAGRARARGIPCLALAGRVDVDATRLRACGIDAAFALDPAARSTPARLAEVARVAEQAVRAFARGRTDAG